MKPARWCPTKCGTPHLQAHVWPSVINMPYSSGNILICSSRLARKLLSGVWTLTEWISCILCPYTTLVVDFHIHISTVSNWKFIVIAGSLGCILMEHTTVLREVCTHRGGPRGSTEKCGVGSFSNFTPRSHQAHQSLGSRFSPGCKSTHTACHSP